MVRRPFLVNLVPGYDSDTTSIVYNFIANLASKKAKINYNRPSEMASGIFALITRNIMYSA